MRGFGVLGRLGLALVHFQKRCRLPGRSRRSRLLGHPRRLHSQSWLKQHRKLALVRELKRSGDLLWP
jgi:hypothetical protein